MTAPSWTPRPGETIHLNPRNRWQLPAGRYRLDHRCGGWSLCNTESDLLFAVVTQAALQAEEQRGPLTPISDYQLARDRFRTDQLFGAHR